VPDPAPPPGVPWRRLEPGARATPRPRSPADVAVPLFANPRCPVRCHPMRPRVRPPFVPELRTLEERALPGSVLNSLPPLTPSSPERDLVDLAGLALGAEGALAPAVGFAGSDAAGPAPPSGDGGAWDSRLIAPLAPAAPADGASGDAAFLPGAGTKTAASLSAD